MRLRETVTAPRRRQQEYKPNEDRLGSQIRRLPGSMSLFQPISGDAIKVMSARHLVNLWVFEAPGEASICRARIRECTKDTKKNKIYSVESHD